jgi:regulator of replication initiation timing
MSNFKSVAESLRNLENERKSLLLEIEELKKMADSKAKALESEVGMLREEVKSLRLLLGAEEPAVDEEQEQKKKPRK